MNFENDEAYRRWYENSEEYQDRQYEKWYEEQKKVKWDICILTFRTILIAEAKVGKTFTQLP